MNLPYLAFVSLLKITSVMIGNSSSAIFESPLFRIPVINIGIRQIGRERGNNVTDVPHTKKEIVRAVRKALADEEFRKAVKKSANPFDIERKGAQKIVAILSEIKIDEKLLQKRLTY
jgi:GDP/UDP-N,N'-diacetylbacillosamine 2-epimerase (hydrolysing)